MTLALRHNYLRPQCSDSAPPPAQGTKERADVHLPWQAVLYLSTRAAG